MHLKILIRLPNWLGDMVMATPLLQAVQLVYPGATVDVIAKKGLDFLLDHIPGINERYIFSKNEYKGLQGAWRFGKMIAAQQRYDLFICLPNSFSAAVMARATGAKMSIGYKKELRSWLLTKTYNQPANLHRVETYMHLLQQYAGVNIPTPPVQLQVTNATRKDIVIVNINSEASSRRLPPAKAVEFITALRNKVRHDLVLIGSLAEQAFVNEVYAALPDKQGIGNEAGKTSLHQLLSLLASARVMLTTDSGPAHLANALGTHTVVLFGAGNELSTAPFNANKTILRLGQLPCEPCVNNECKLYGSPRCLELLDQQLVTQAVVNALQVTL